MTAGELMAKLLQGDKSVSMKDVEKATVNFFESKGVNCTISEKQEEHDRG